MPIIYLCMVVAYLIYLPRKIDGHTTGSQRVGFIPKDHSLHVTSRCQQLNMTPQDPTPMPMLYKNALLLALSTFCGSPIPINWRHRGHHQPWLAQRLLLHDNIRGESKARSASILANCWSRPSSTSFIVHRHYHVATIFADVVPATALAMPLPSILALYRMWVLAPERANEPIEPMCICYRTWN